MERLCSWILGGRGHSQAPSVQKQKDKSGAETLQMFVPKTPRTSVSAIGASSFQGVKGRCRPWHEEILWLKWGSATHYPKGGLFFSTACNSPTSWMKKLRARLSPLTQFIQ